MSSIDHLVVGSNDLDGLEAWWKEVAGEAAEPGGAHVGRGTRNALVGLGPTTYLELIGPDPAQVDHVGPRSFGVDQLVDSQPVLLTFAVAVDDLDAARATYEAAGVATTEPFPMERLTPR
ncbi:MAG: VOC family protein [Acidimicrobiales bacterium]